MTHSGNKLKLGDIEIIRLVDGVFRVDGGAMFGVVPRTLWEKRAVPDGDNRITLTLNCYLVRTPMATAVIETGVGPDVGRRFADFYSLEKGEGLFRALAGAGVHPEDVDLVLNSHLHFDHCGGNTLKDEAGGWTPAFPRARYIIQKGEWAQALNPVGRDRPSYFPDRLLCLDAHGVLGLVDGDAEVSAGIRTVLTPGHTGFHQGIRITSGSESFFYFGDTIPTAAHVDLPYIMSFDLYPVETYDTKMRLYEQAVAEAWTVGFSHDAANPFGIIRRSGRRFEFTAPG